MSAAIPCFAGSIDKHPFLALQSSSPGSTELADKFVGLLSREELSAAYELLDIGFKVSMSKEEFEEAVRLLHASYGRPSRYSPVGGTSGVMWTADGEQLPIESILFAATLVRPDGTTEEGFIKITLQAGLTVEPTGIMKFVYTPQSNILHRGTYKLRP